MTVILLFSLLFATVVCIEVRGKVSKISSFGMVTCFITREDRIKCFGQSIHGTLGIGENVTESGTLQIASLDGLTGDFTAKTVCGGDNYACAIDKVSHSIRRWGNSAFSGLNSSSPEWQIIWNASESLPVALGENAEDLACGADHACAVLANFSLARWGNNHKNQLGFNSSEEFGLLPTIIAENVVDVCCGRQFTEIVAQMRVTSRWQYQFFGSSDYGETGYGDGLDPVLSGENGFVKLSNDSEVYASALYCGVYETCATLGEDESAAACWGRNYDLQLGHYFWGPVSPPFSLAPVHFSANEAIAGIAFTRYSAAFLTALGDVKALGSNSRGGLGTGGASVERHVGLSNSSVPFVKVDNSSLSIVQISASENCLCAVFQTGHVKCWGHEQAVAQPGLPFGVYFIGKDGYAPWNFDTITVGHYVDTSIDYFPPFNDDATTTTTSAHSGNLTFNPDIATQPESDAQLILLLSVTISSAVVTVAAAIIIFVFLARHRGRRRKASSDTDDGLSPRSPRSPRLSRRSGARSRRKSHRASTTVTDYGVISALPGNAVSYSENVSVDHSLGVEGYDYDKPKVAQTSSPRYVNLVATGNASSGSNIYTNEPVAFQGEMYSDLLHISEQVYSYGEPEVAKEKKEENVYTYGSVDTEQRVNSDNVYTYSNVAAVDASSNQIFSYGSLEK